MFKRPFNTVLARLGLVAAVLATLLILAPVASAADPIKISYEENRMDAVEEFTAVDEDEGGDPEWSLEGVDAGGFDLEDGVLTFKESPDYEDPTDIDESGDLGDQGLKDNVYKITLVVTTGATVKQPVEVTVVNMDEPGKVTFTKPQPQVGRGLEAKLADDDGRDSPEWQWSRGASMDGPWTDIDGAATASRTPVAADSGSYLRATVTYEDSFSAGKVVSGVTKNAVEGRTVSNAAPSFSGSDENDTAPEVQVIRKVDEGVSGNLGDPIVATDAENDVLLYSIVADVDTSGNGTVESTTDITDITNEDITDDEKFSISGSGQLSLKEKQDFEAAGSRTADDDDDDMIPYTVKIRATDPSGATGDATVTVTLMNVNEAPVFTKVDGKFVGTTLYIDEDADFEVDPDSPTLTGHLFTDEAGEDGVEVYDATDDDTADEPGAVTYTVEGADKKFFAISLTDGVLTPRAALAPALDFEMKSSYSIDIVATSGGAVGADAASRSTRARHGRLAVTIMVIDEDDAGNVRLSQREPQVDRPVVATLLDDDAKVSNQEWQWFRGGGALSLDQVTAYLDDDTATIPSPPIPECSGTEVADTTLCAIKGATSAIYTPVAADAKKDANAADPVDTDGLLLQVGVIYRDTHGAHSAAGISQEPVQASSPGNTRPAFPDQDTSTVEDESDSTMREVEEGKKDENVGDPIRAGDSDNEPLIYTLSGPDMASFVLGSGLDYDEIGEGQLRTKVKLDYETKSEYMVTVTATDPSGASDSIAVTIMVIDVDEPPMVVGATPSEPIEISYMENGMAMVGEFSTTEVDEGGDPEWSLEGVDAGGFDLEDGVLTFKESPDYEDPTDIDESGDLGDQGLKDNVYKITLVASTTGATAKQPVEVTVVNMDEPGKVTFTKPQPQVGRGLEAKLADDDGRDSPEWQWSRGASMDGPWTDIDGAATASRTPVAADSGSYLRATVTYEDSFSAGKVVSGVTKNAVEGRTVSNAAPSFSGSDENDDLPEVQVIRKVDEGVSGNLGDPIVATDAENDVLLYSIVADVDTDDDGSVTGDEDATDDEKFSISGSGQLSLKEKQDFEDAGSKLDDNDDTDINETADDADDDMIPYTVKIRATDPSGATGDATVTVTLMNVNEAPVFTKVDGKFIGTTLYIDEDADFGLDPDSPTLTGHLFTDEAGEDAAAPYDATDEDTADGPAAVTYTVEGADKKFFAISLTDGALTPRAALAPALDFEMKSSYSIDIVATSGGTDADERDDRDRHGRLAVTIMVIDEDDAGNVRLSQREPQVDRPVVATLLEDDAKVSNQEWQWYRGGPALTEGQVTTETDDNDDNDIDECSRTNVAADDDPCVIKGATSAIYTPVAADARRDADTDGLLLQVLLTYRDTHGVHSAVGKSQKAVQMSKPGNTRPAFPDQDTSTVEDESDSTMREVEEGKKDENVGDPIRAGDSDNEPLIYTLSGPDAASFKLGSGLDHDDIGEGQLQTKVKLDYEAKSEYMVTVTATDPSGASDSIAVTIMVIDVDEGATISLGPAVNIAPAFPGATANRSVDENMYAGAFVGDAVTADDPGDTLAYMLSESMYFKIDENSGQITTTMTLDEEDMSSHMVTVTATDSEGETDSVSVAITVSDSQPGCDTVGDMGLVNDCEALLDSEDALGGSLNWADDTPMSDWDGVMMSGDRVTAVNLRDQGLDGMIPAALGRLSELTSLNLRSNADLAGEIPGSLNDLSDLTVLNLHSNSHTGEIPDLSGTSLVELYLPGNELTGSVPEWLNTMTDMTELWLWGNNLSGTMPDLSGMTSLDKLKLNGNMVSGFQADMLASGLRWLIIGQTDIGANAPDLSGMMSLTTLWMNETGLSGVIPVAGIPTSVTSLNLKDNMLSGTIPDMSGLDNLVLLRLHRNQLSGDIPGTLGDLESIERIWAYDNDLTGIAAGFANAADTLTHLYLDGNSFAEGTCLPGDLADVANNDFEMAGLAACAP